MVKFSLGAHWVTKLATGKMSLLPNSGDAIGLIIKVACGIGALLVIGKYVAADSGIQYLYSRNNWNI